MFRTIFMIGLLAFAGLFLLQLAFGILGGLFGVFFWLLGKAIPILILGVVVYFLLRLFAPETAKELREKFGGN